MGREEPVGSAEFLVGDGKVRDLVLSFGLVIVGAMPQDVELLPFDRLLADPVVELILLFEFPDPLEEALPLLLELLLQLEHFHPV